jgi:MIP family channel proteins
MGLERIGQRAAAEFIATFSLVFIGAGSVVVLGGRDAASLLGIAVAHGLVLAIMVSVLGHISGGHVNPAVTISAWVTNQIATAAAIVYIVAQLAGAIAGAAMLKVALPARITTDSTLGTPQVNHAFMSNGRAVLLEAVLTFFLVFAVYGTAIDERGPFAKTAGLTIGLVLVFDILVGGPWTGAAMNPAIWFGPALISGTWPDWWVYLIGPIGGGVIAA